MKRRLPLLFVALALFFSACGVQTSTPDALTEIPDAATESLRPVMYTDPSQPVEKRIDALLSRMTLDEKIGQMAQVAKNSIKPGDIEKYYIGSILSGGGSPEENTLQAWYAMVEGHQKEALDTRLQIPININNAAGKAGCDAPLFPLGYGLEYSDPSPEILDCD